MNKASTVPFGIVSSAIAAKLPEDRWVDFDEDSDCWGVFGVDSGFCYGLYADEESAENSIED